ncbi:MAG: RDD family protein [Acidimicrobiia bacterium]|nr:RDD family protein [Acidimicrobiia bacterium]
MNGQAAAGWYHAEGDPVGTLRYWDGAQWVGDPQYPPQPAAQQAPPQVPPPGGAPFQPAPSGPESWSSPGWSGQQGPAREKGGIGARLLAYIIDMLIMFLPFVVLVAVGGEDSSFGGIGALLLIGIFIWNSVYRQGTTGQSVGKSAVNVTLLGKDDHQPIGIGKALGRAFLGWILNSIFPIDLIWALFDGQNQRLVDKILNSNVFRSQLDL